MTSLPQSLPAIPRFEVLPTTRALYDRLAQLDPGGRASYAELSALIRADVQGDARHLLDSARGMLERAGIATGCVTNWGIIRPQPAGVIAMGESVVESVRRKVRKGRRIVGTVTDLGALSPSERQRHLFVSARLGIFHLFGTRKASRALAGAVETANSAAPSAGLIEATLSLFRKRA